MCESSSEAKKIILFGKYNGKKKNVNKEKVTTNWRHNKRRIIHMMPIIIKVSSIQC